MYVFIFFAVVLLFSFTLAVIDKISDYRKTDKSVWQDNDSVLVKSGDKDNPHQIEGGMIRIQ